MNSESRATSKTNFKISQRISSYSVALSALAFAMIALPTSAQAQNECGAPAGGTVTCSPNDNPFPNGVTYFPANDLTVELQSGVVIDTSASFNNGLLLFGDEGAITVNGGTNTLITAGQFGIPVLAATNAGNITLNLDRVIGVQSAINASSGTGAIRVKANTVTTSGNGATGVSATGNSGNVAVNVGSVTTTGTNSRGINATTDGNITVGFTNITSTGTGVDTTGGSSSVVAVNGGNVTTSANNAIGVRARGNFAIGSTGSIGVTTDNVSTAGTGADGINVESRFSSAAVNAGTITTTGNNARGIVAIGGTTANLNFNTISTTGIGATGVVVPGGSLFVRPTANAIVTGGTITTQGDNAVGVNIAANTSANVNVVSIRTAGAGATGILIPVATSGFFGSPATPTATLSAGSITTAGANAFGINASVTDALNITAGSVSTSGVNAKAINAASTAGNATVTVNGALRTTGTAADVLTVSSGGNSTVNFSAGGSFAATQGNFINLDSLGTSTLNNAGTIGNNSNGLALAAIGGPITINNSGSLNSDILLTSGADRINNSGNFVVGVNPDFGAGLDTFNNSGIIQVGLGAAMAVSPIFTGLETLTNSGTISLVNGRTGDSLTLPGAYAGANGTLALDILLNGTTNPSDQLIVGGLATGTTIVSLNQLAGSQAVFSPGTVLVRAATGSAANAFDLAGGSLDSGFVRLDIQYNAANGTYFLTGAPSDTAFRTLNYAEGIRSIWLKSADVVSAQLRTRRDTLWSQGGTEPTGRLWMQIHGSVETREGQRDFNAFGQSRVTNTGYEQDYFGGQIGLDIVGGSGERGGFAAGVTGGYISSSMNFAGSADRLRFDVINGGVYGSYSAGNFFFNALGKYDYYWADAKGGNSGFQQDVNGSVYGARGEVGLRFGNDSFFIEPAASISFVTSDFDDLNPAGANISFDEDDGLRGRIGGRIGGLINTGAAKVSIYAGANYVHEFEGKDKVTFTSGGQTLVYTNNRLRDYGEATLGVTIAQNQSVSGFIEGNYIRSFNKNGSNLGIEGAGGRAGLRIKF